MDRAAPPASTAPRLRLDEPLPAEVLRGVSGGLAAYRNYPAFSWLWLRKRTLLFVLVLSGFGALGGLRVWLGSRDLGNAVAVGALSVLGFLGIATIGPLLATGVRHLRLRLRRERVLVVVALLVGMVGALGVDTWASDAIEGRLPGRPAGKTLENAQTPLSLAFNLVVLAAIYGTLGGGLALRAYFGEPRRLAELARQRELADLRTAKHNADVRLGVLQAQVEPHFLFNTLASVRSLIASDPARAASTIDALVDYLRATIPRLRDDAAAVVSTLGQQVDLCARYLELMAVRMGGRLGYDIAVEPALRATEFPPLLLISLVENAVKHGIEPKPGPGRIRISAAIRGDMLEVKVSDDGAGLRGELGSGTGLANLRAQLAARHGDRARFTLSAAPGSGTEAVIELPHVEAG